MLNINNQKPDHLSIQLYAGSHDWNGSVTQDG